MRAIDLEHMRAWMVRWTGYEIAAFERLTIWYGIGLLGWSLAGYGFMRKHFVSYVIESVVSSNESTCSMDPLSVSTLELNIGTC